MTHELFKQTVNEFAVAHSMRLTTYTMQGNTCSATFSKAVGDKRTVEITDVRELTSEQLATLLEALL